MAIYLISALFLLGIAGGLIYLAIHNTKEPRFPYLIFAGIILIILGSLMMWHPIMFCECMQEYGNTTSVGYVQEFTPFYEYINVTTDKYSCCVWEPMFQAALNVTDDPEVDPVTVDTFLNIRIGIGILIIFIGVYTFFAGMLTPLESYNERKRRDND